MATVTSTVETSLVRHTWVEARDDCNHKITVDQPINSAGTDKGMDPIKLVLAGLGSCLTLSARQLAPHFQIDLRDFSVEVSGEYAFGHFQNSADFQPGLLNVNFIYHIRTFAADEKIREFLAYVEAHCPVVNTIKNPVHVKPAEIIIEDPLYQAADHKMQSSSSSL